MNPPQIHNSCSISKTNYAGLSRKTQGAASSENTASPPPRTCLLQLPDALQAFLLRALQLLRTLGQGGLGSLVLRLKCHIGGGRDQWN
jgi:hypothetical protein